MTSSNKEKCMPLPKPCHYIRHIEDKLAYLLFACLTTGITAALRFTSENKVLKSNLNSNRNK